LRFPKSRRRIGQETFGFGDGARKHSSLDDLAQLIDWAPRWHFCAAKGEPARRSLALFNALLLAVWYDLSDVKLAEALDDRTSFRRFCGLSAAEPTPERTAFVRFRKALTIRAVDRQMFDEVTGQLKSNSSPVFVTLGAALYLVKMLAASAGSRHWPGLSVW
jgi:transposase, IS5 family